MVLVQLPYTKVAGTCRCWRLLNLVAQVSSSLALRDVRAWRNKILLSTTCGSTSEWVYSQAIIVNIKVFNSKAPQWVWKSPPGTKRWAGCVKMIFDLCFARLDTSGEVSLLASLVVRYSKIEARNEPGSLEDVAGDRGFWYSFTLRILVLWRTVYPHMWLSVEWETVCCWGPYLSLNPAPHSSHSYGFSSLWTSWCDLSSDKRSFLSWPVLCTESMLCSNVGSRSQDIWISYCRTDQGTLKVRNVLCPSMLSVVNFLRFALFAFSASLVSVNPAVASFTSTAGFMSSKCLRYICSCRSLRHPNTTPQRKQWHAFLCHFSLWLRGWKSGSDKPPKYGSDQKDHGPQLFLPLRH